MKPFSCMWNEANKVFPCTVSTSSNKHSNLRVTQRNVALQNIPVVASVGKIWANPIGRLRHRTMWMKRSLWNPMSHATSFSRANSKQPVIMLFFESARFFPSTTSKNCEFKNYPLIHLLSNFSRSSGIFHIFINYAQACVHIPLETKPTVDGRGLNVKWKSVVTLY